MKLNLHYAILLLLLFIVFKYTVLGWGRENIESVRKLNLLTEFIFQERHVPSSYMLPFSSLFFPAFLHQQVVDNFFFFLFMDDVIYFSLFCEGLLGIYLLYYCVVPLYYVKGLHDVTPGKRVKKKVAGKTPPEYPNAWYHVMYSDELKAGEVKGVEMLGRRLVIYRSEVAPYHPALLDAFCVHLGADLSEGGKVKGDCIQCPFHGWKFDPTGKCVEIAYQSPLHPDYVKSKLLPFPSSSPSPSSSSSSQKGGGGMGGGNNNNINLIHPPSPSPLDHSLRDRRKQGGRKGEGKDDHREDGKRKKDRSKSSSDHSSDSIHPLPSPASSSSSSSSRGEVGRGGGGEVGRGGGDIPEYARMKSWPIREYNGRIYLWYHAGNLPPDWEPPSLPQYNGSSIFHGRSSHTVAVHIQDIPENGADSAHLFFLHPPFVNKWMGRLMHLTHSWNTDWIPGSDLASSHTAFCDLHHRVMVLNKWYIPGSEISVKVHMIGPSLVHIQFRTLFGNIYAIQSITPIEPELQRCLHDIWADWTVPRPFVKLALRSIIVQFERDIVMWNAKTHQHRPMLVKGDGKIMQFRRWFSQFYSKESYEPIANNIGSLSW